MYQFFFFFHVFFILCEHRGTETQRDILFLNIRISPNCHVGAYRIRPNTSTNPRGCLQGVCDTPLHGMFADIQIILW